MKWQGRLNIITARSDTCLFLCTINIDLGHLGMLVFYKKAWPFKAKVPASGDTASSFLIKPIEFRFVAFSSRWCVLSLLSHSLLFTSIYSCLHSFCVYTCSFSTTALAFQSSSSSNDALSLFSMFVFAVFRFIGHKISADDRLINVLTRNGTTKHTYTSDRMLWDLAPRSSGLGTRCFCCYIL